VRRGGPGGCTGSGEGKRSARSRLRGVGPLHAERWGRHCLANRIQTRLLILTMQQSAEQRQAAGAMAARISTTRRPEHRAASYRTLPTRDSTTHRWWLAPLGWLARGKKPLPLCASKGTHKRMKDELYKLGLNVKLCRLLDLEGQGEPRQRHDTDGLRAAAFAASSRFQSWLHVQPSFNLPQARSLHRHSYIHYVAPQCHPYRLPKYSLRSSLTLTSIHDTGWLFWTRQNSRQTQPPRALPPPLPPHSGLLPRT
jgi:hypothetical protein